MGKAKKPSAPLASHPTPKIRFWLRKSSLYPSPPKRLWEVGREVHVSHFTLLYFVWRWMPLVGAHWLSVPIIVSLIKFRQSDQVNLTSQQRINAETLCRRQSKNYRDDLASQSIRSVLVLNLILTLSSSILSKLQLCPLRLTSVLSA